MQQINLYRRSDRTGASGTGLLNGKTVALGLAVVVVALLALSVFGNWRLARLERELAALSAQQAQSLARLERAGSVPGGKSPAQIEAHIKTLTGAVARRGQALGAIESGEAGSPQGFASRLEALARSHLEGLWLERMSLSSRDHALALSGHALEVDLVPRYLAALARQPVLSGTRFGHLNIERKSELAPVRFEVATVAPALAADGGSASMPEGGS